MANVQRYGVAVIEELRARDQGEMPNVDVVLAMVARSDLSFAEKRVLARAALDCRRRLLEDERRKEATRVARQAAEAEDLAKLTAEFGDASNG